MLVAFVFLLLGLFFMYGFFKASMDENDLATLAFWLSVMFLYIGVVIMVYFR